MKKLLDKEEKLKKLMKRFNLVKSNLVVKDSKGWKTKGNVTDRSSLGKGNYRHKADDG